MSPITAFLPCPTVKGPVGFAETNSTIAFLPAYLEDFPKSSAFSKIVLMIEVVAEELK